MPTRRFDAVTTGSALNPNRGIRFDGRGHRLAGAHGDHARGHDLPDRRRHADRSGSEREKDGRA